MFSDARWSLGSSNNPNGKGYPFYGHDFNRFRFYYVVTSAWLDPQFIAALRCSARRTRLEGPVHDHDRRGDGRSPTILEFLTREMPPAPPSVLAQAASPLLVPADVISED